MNFCTPNLPSGKVNQMLVSSILPQDITDELISLGVEPIKLGKSLRIKSELAYHPDILVFNYKPGKWLVEYDSAYFPGNNLNVNEMLTPVKYHIGNKYPADCIFNSFVIGKTIFCGFVNVGMYENIDELEDFSFISFKQGYTKCSVIPVNENAFITSDKAIYKKLKEMKFDCLYAEADSILLNGYSNGFIGGCAGKVSKDLLVFTGNIELHNSYTSIRDFCRNYGVEVYSLSKDPLYDYGGLLPVSEVQ
jgi:hypothetical protein